MRPRYTAADRPGQRNCNLNEADFLSLCCTSAFRRLLTSEDLPSLTLPKNNASLSSAFELLRLAGSTLSPLPFRKTSPDPSRESCNPFRTVIPKSRNPTAIYIRRASPAGSRSSPDPNIPNRSIAPCQQLPQVTTRERLSKSATNHA